jgi:hypothetical protein
MSKKEEIKLSINEFLSAYSQKRNLDDVFRKWFFQRDKSNPKKTIAEWQGLLAEFYA